MPLLGGVELLHNIKVGGTYEHTFITERDAFGLVDPTASARRLNADGSAYTNPLLTNPADCGSGLQANLGQGSVPAFIPLLACYDLTRTAPLPASDGCPNSTSGLLGFFGHADIKELALCFHGAITVGSWTFNLGVRFDKYNGITSAAQGEPRLITGDTPVVAAAVEQKWHTPARTCFWLGMIFGISWRLFKLPVAAIRSFCRISAELFLWMRWVLILNAARLLPCRGLSGFETRK